jgi:hypothetical protein
VDVIFLACNRAAAAESLACIPDDEKPTIDDLEGYVERYGAEARKDGDIAWGPYYPELLAWLSDRNMRKKHSKENALPQQMNNPSRGFR